MDVTDQTSELDPPVTKGEEWRTFFILAVLLAPALAVAIVGSYGFIIWMSQLLLGPPSH
ncbi:periplasmic nitrate reductase, NapE protein [Rhodobacteraceae bacterium KN286]|uniref:Periplasmic nitrate reductase, NapE protein n=1 Tax=Oceanomicrobium pacificus TaxID=2692916 RepID=A0A6B0TV14_9RHOB|nr:periplasmic nitrate reductase, NapE protein [Oceanomicrobium pacificus]